MKVFRQTDVSSHNKDHNTKKVTLFILKSVATFVFPLQIRNEIIPIHPFVTILAKYFFQQ
jgi:hypothetical protein